MTPTEELYSSLQLAADFFNQELFGGRLGPVVLTVDCNKKYLGYFHPERWRRDSGEFIHQISLNSGMFAAAPLMSVLCVIVHEQCHQLQEEYGSPSRRSYHNKEWGMMMREVGLEPTNYKGGDVGDKCGEFIVEDGPFMRACIKLVQDKSFKISVTDRQVMAPFAIPMNGDNEGETPKLTLDSAVTKSDLPMIHELLEQKAIDDTLKILENSGLEASVIDILSNPLTKSDSTDGDFHTDNSVSKYLPKPKRHGNRAKYICSRCSSHLLGKPGILVNCFDCKFLMIDEGLQEAFIELIERNVKDLASHKNAVIYLVINALINRISLDDFVGFIDYSKNYMWEEAHKIINEAELSFTFSKDTNDIQYWSITDLDKHLSEEKIKTTARS